MAAGGSAIDMTTLSGGTAIVLSGGLLLAPSGTLLEADSITTSGTLLANRRHLAVLPATIIEMFGLIELHGGGKRDSISGDGFNSNGTKRWATA